MQKLIKKHIDGLSPTARRETIMKWASLPLWIFLGINVIALLSIIGLGSVGIDVPSWLEGLLGGISVILRGILVFNFFSIIVFFQLRKFARNHMLWKQYQRDVARASGQRSPIKKPLFRR